MKMADVEPKPKINISPEWHPSLKAAVSSLSVCNPFKGFLLILNRINSSNAMNAVSFVNANCSVSRPEKPEFFPMASIYSTGLNTLNDFLEYGKEPEYVEHWSALKSLSDFIEELEWIQLAKRLHRRKWSEEDVLIILLHHFLLKLRSHQDNEDDPCSLDNSSKKQTSVCPCCLEILTARYGDTSFGNTKVWHGRMDAIFEEGISISNLEDVESSYSYIVEGKNSSVPGEIDVHQILARTITFSFLQNFDPGQFSLYPNISISKKCVQLRFYDSVHDILLESQEYELFNNRGIDMTVIVTLWLVLNHRLYCTGVTQEMKDSSFKAEFLKGHDEAKEIYKSQLRYCCGSGKQNEYSVLNYMKEKITAKRYTFRYTPPAKKPKL